MGFRLFGRHLHNQIVIPLLAASVTVALIATFVGVYQLSSIINTWIDGQTNQAAHVAVAQLDRVRGRLEGDAIFVSEDAALVRALSSADATTAGRLVPPLSTRVAADDVIVVDANGRPVASSTTRLVGPIANGDEVLSAQTMEYTRRNIEFTTLLTLRGQQVIASVVTRKLGSDRFTFVVARELDNEFLSQNFQGLAAGIALYTAQMKPQSAYVDASLMGQPDPANAKKASAALGAALAGSATGDPTGVKTGVTAALATTGTIVSSPGGSYSILAEQISFDHEAPRQTGGISRIDPTGASAYLVLVVSSAVASDSRQATIGLIAFWSALAVLVLTGLGTIIARKVSTPLSALSASARKVAEGDFSARVDIPGTNEVAELAETFNAMTESLRERTETLTKKVLELATLYEMSRALGSTLDLDVLLDSVLDSAMRIFNVNSGYVMLRDKNSGRLDLRAWRGMSGALPDEGAIRSSMSDWVVRQGRPLIFNPPADSSSEQHVDSMTGALAALCVPLVSSEGVVGAIAVGSRDRTFRFSSDDVRLLSTIANHVTIAIGNIELFSSLQDAYLATVRSLAAAVDAKDPYTHGHSDRVATYAAAIAAKLDLSGEQRIALEMAAYLHDIGKIGIRESILLKPGKLTDEEMGQMRHHPLIGANILKPVAFPWPIAPVVRHHHERFDGGGYPAGLKGEEIPLLARILTVADAFEAMTSDRPYRSGRTEEEAIEELHSCEGGHFDPRIVAAFIEALPEIEAGNAALGQRVLDDVQPEEARAIFVAIADGMFASFRRLGGPRLASNLESTMNEYFREMAIEFQLSGGHLTARWDSETADDQLEQMRAVIARMASSMEATSGRSLVDHFYDEAVSDMSERMRRSALLLDLYPLE
jgi:putative nucleotidyltransferase with HDIG domain